MTTIDELELDQFKFLVINTPTLWKKGTVEGELEFEGGDDDDQINSKTGGIRLSQYQHFFRTKEFQIPISKVIDLALDPACAISYILESDSKKLYVLDMNTGILDWIQCVQFENPRAIEVGRSDIYVLDGNDIITIAKVNFQTRRTFREVGVNPGAIALDNGEQNIFVLDSQEKQIYSISNTNGIVSSLLAKDEERNTLSFATAITIGKRDDKIYILDTERKEVIVFYYVNETELVHDSIALDGSVQFMPSGLAALDKQNIFVGDKGLASENTPHPRKYSSNGTILMETLEYSGPSEKVVLSREGDCLFVFNFRDGWIIKFALGKKFASYGGYVTYALDSGIFGLEWHKFVIDRDIPDAVNNVIEISYSASDSDVVPTEGQWIGSPLPNPRDALMFEANGRYLWFKIGLYSKNYRTTPTIHQIRAYFPRLSYLRYLPAIYQDDNVSKIFLERFLSLFETFFTQIDEFNFTKYIDPASSPDGFLPWLASWLALGNDENWPRKNFRKLIEFAPHLFRMRGTRRGLEKVLGIYLATPKELESIHVNDELDIIDGSNADNHDTTTTVEDSTELAREYKFMIFESFQLNIVKNDNNYMKLFCRDPYTFCVLLNPNIIDEKKAQVVRRIVESEKPAHTIGNVTLLQPWFYLGMHTYLGINTKLERPRFILGESTIARDTVIGKDDISGRIDISSRVGIDTHIS